MACFVKTMTRESVKDIEIGNPFLRMKVFSLFGVENKPLTLETVPQFFRPYPGCIFDVLSEPDKEKRKEGMVKFFANLCNETCPTRKFSLFYTVMHCWKATFAVSMSHPPQRHILRTFEWFVETGMFQSLTRILNLCLDQDFLGIEYNRYIPYRILETMFGAMQAELVNGDNIIKKVVEDNDLAVRTFVPLMEGKISFTEQLLAQQVIGNFSCYPQGMILLVNAPKLAGLTGKFLWIAYDLPWFNYTQYEERKIAMHRHLLNTDIELELEPAPRVYLPGPHRCPDLCAYSALCCMCNICAGFPDECPMEQVDECLIELVNQGYYWHLGTVATGIHLSQPKYAELTIDKFLSLTSWSAFNHVNQMVIVDQLKSLPSTRKEEPLMFFPRSKFRGRSVVAFLITHALWFDFDRGTHFSILGLMYLLKEIPEVGKAVIETIGPQLVDLAHSIHHVKLPGDGDPMAVKRGIFEPIMELAGIPYYDEQGDVIEPYDRVYEVGEWPECVIEMREFCQRNIREIKLKREEKEKRVLLADALKLEGNAFYDKEELEAAIECYTQALNTCPLMCTEKRVTYYSNRAECYLQTNQPRKAVKDCSRALAMNPFNMKVRWRRSQAYQRIGYNYPAALDLLTIQGKEEDALKILGKTAYKELETTIFDLLDKKDFRTSAAHKFSNLKHNDLVQKTAWIKLHELDRGCVPPYRAKTYKEIIGRSPGGFELEYDSENEEENPNPTEKWSEDLEGEVDELECELRREKGKFDKRWLYRDVNYRTPAQKIGLERELLDQRRLLLESFAEKRKNKQKLVSGKEISSGESEPKDGADSAQRGREELEGGMKTYPDGTTVEEKGGSQGGIKATEDLDPEECFMSMSSLDVNCDVTEKDVEEIEAMQTK